MPNVLFEIRHLIAAPVTLALLLQFAALAWLMPRLPRPVFWVIAVPFIIQDVLYQITVGTFLFWERPREFMFTTRLKRLDGIDPHVERFKNVLNELDKGHV